MTGLVLLSEPPTQEHLRFQVCLITPENRRKSNDRKSKPRKQRFAKPRTVLLGPPRIGFRLPVVGRGVCRIFHGNDKKLGPNALEISVDELRLRFQKSRRAIKVALLDQAAIAGIGNLYASEILHAAGVHPAVALPSNEVGTMEANPRRTA